eukprot:gene2754-8131_t
MRLHTEAGRLVRKSRSRRANKRNTAASACVPLAHAQPSSGRAERTVRDGEELGDMSEQCPIDWSLVVQSVKDRGVHRGILFIKTMEIVVWWFLFPQVVKIASLPGVLFDYTIQIFSLHCVNADDSDGVWSPDIEEAFEEALKIYPPCGRRKIILSEEGKMYGRNELIARYIKMKTGKVRSRKQVSSHIQVLARKRQRELQTQLKTNPEAAEKLAETLRGLSSAEIVSGSLDSSDSSQRAERSMTYGGTPSKPEAGFSRSTNGNNNVLFPDAFYQQQQQAQQQILLSQQQLSQLAIGQQAVQNSNTSPASRTTPGIDTNHTAGMAPQITYNGIARLRLALDYFSTGITYPFQAGVHKFFELAGSYHFADPSMECVDIYQIADKFPHLEELYRTGPKEAFFVVKVWADLNFDSSKIQQIAHEDDNGIIDPKPEEAVFNLAAQFESLENIPIECTTSAVSLGNIAAEKIQTQAARFEGGRFVYDMTSGTMCEYMTQFISHLRGVTGIELINLVLENFAIMQVVRCQSNNEVLFSAAYLFEAVPPGTETGIHVYKLLDMKEELVLRRNTA